MIFGGVWTLGASFHVVGVKVSPEVVRRNSYGFHAVVRGNFALFVSISYFVKDGVRNLSETEILFYRPNVLPSIEIRVVKEKCQEPVREGSGNFHGCQRT